MSNQLPDRPSDFVPDNSVHLNMTDYKGVLHSKPLFDYEAAWAIVKQRWLLNQGGFAPTDVVAVMDREQVVREIKGGEE